MSVKGSEEVPDELVAPEAFRRCGGFVCSNTNIWARGLFPPSPNAETGPGAENQHIVEFESFPHNPSLLVDVCLKDEHTIRFASAKGSCIILSTFQCQPMASKLPSQGDHFSKCTPLIIQQNVKASKGSGTQKLPRTGENPLSCICWVTPDIIAVGYRNGVLRCYSGLTGELLLSKLFQKGKATLVSLRIFRCCVSDDTMDTREKGLWALYRDGSIVCMRLKDLLDGAYSVNNDVKYKRWKCQQRNKHITPLDFVCSIPFRTEPFDLRPKAGVNISVSGEDPTLSQFFVKVEENQEIDTLGGLASVVMGAAFSTATSWFSSASTNSTQEQKERGQSGGVQKRNNDTWDDSWEDIETKSIKSKVFVKDGHRVGESMLLSPSGLFACVTDNLGRILLLDTDDMSIRRIWKGYRSAQCGWIVENCGLASETKGKTQKEYLVIYAPQRSLIDIMSCSYGPRIARIHDTTMLANGRLLYCNGLNSGLDSDKILSRCFFLKRNHNAVTHRVNPTKKNAKHHPAKVDFFEITIDKQGSQVIKHARMSSLHQDEGYLLHRFLNSLNVYIKSVKEIQANQQDGREFHAHNTEASVDLDSLKKVNAPVLLVRALGEIHDLMQTLPFTTPNLFDDSGHAKSFAKAPMFSSGLLREIFSIFLSRLKRAILDENNDVSAKEVRHHIHTLQDKLNLLNTYMALECIPMNKTLDIKATEHVSNVGEEVSFRTSNVGMQFKTWHDMWNNYTSNMAKASTEDSPGENGSLGYNIIRMNPYSFILCFESTGENMELSDYCKCNATIKRGLLRFIFQALLLHSFDVKVLFDFQKKISSYGFASKQLLNLFHEWFFDVPFCVILNAYPEKLLDSPVVKWLHSFTLSHDVFMNNPFPSKTLKLKSSDASEGSIFHRLLLNHTLAVVWEKKMQMFERDQMYEEVQAFFCNSEGGDNNAIIGKFHAHVDSYFETREGAELLKSSAISYDEDGNIILTNNVIDMLVANARDTYCKQLNVQTIKLEVSLFIRVCAAMVISRYELFTKNLYRDSSESMLWNEKVLQRIAVNDSPAENSIDLEVLIAMLQLLQNEMQPDLGKNQLEANFKAMFQNFLSNRNLILQKYSSISAGGDHQCFDFMKWFENEWLLSDNSRPKTSLFKYCESSLQPDSTNDNAKDTYSAFIGFTNTCSKTFLSDLLGHDHTNSEMKEPENPLELLITLFSGFIDTDNVAMHRTMLRVNYFNYDNAGKYLRLYNHDMLHTDIHDVGNCTSLTVPIKKLQEAIADVSTIKQERRTCRLICYLSILDRCVLQKISFLKNLWEKSPLDGIQNLIRDMIHSRRDGKTDRSVVTNDEITKNISTLLDRFTESFDKTDTSDNNAPKHSTLAKNGWCDEILRASKRQQGAYISLVLNLLHLIRHEICADEKAGEFMIDTSTPICSVDLDRRRNNINMHILQCIGVDNLRSRYRDKVIKMQDFEKFVMMIRVLQINIDCCLWKVDVEKLYASQTAKLPLESYFHPGNHGKFLVLKEPGESGAQVLTTGGEEFASMDLVEFSLTGESPIYMQYRMRTVVEIMMKDKTNGYKTAFELAVALKVPKWFIQFEYIKRLIKTGKELYAEEELRKLDFKVDESVEMAKLLLGFCATQLVDVIKAMKSERKYRSLVASIPGESYRLALSLGKKFDAKVEKMEFARPRRRVLYPEYVLDNSVHLQEDVVDEDMEEDDEEVEPSLSATHAFFTILGNVLERSSKHQQYAMTLAETVSSLQDAARRL